MQRRLCWCRMRKPASPSQTRSLNLAFINFFSFCKQVGFFYNLLVCKSPSLSVLYVFTSFLLIFRIFYGQQQKRKNLKLQTIQLFRGNDGVCGKICSFSCITTLQRQFASFSIMTINAQRCHFLQMPAILGCKK